MTVHSALANSTSDEYEGFLPVTLSADWSRVVRLLILATLAVFGSIGNVFMISSVMIEDHLKKKGNTFLANLAIADLLVTGLIMPASVIMLLADLKEIQHPVCRFQWCLVLLCCLVTVLTLVAIAAENYCRLCCSHVYYDRLTAGCITAVVLFIWLLSILAVYFTFEYGGLNFCGRPFDHTQLPQLLVAAVLIVGPALISGFFFIRLAIIVHSFKSRTVSNFKPGNALNWDIELVKTNAYSLILFVAFWLPTCILLIVACVRTQPEHLKVFNTLAWLAMTKSCWNNLLYCCTNRHFRSAYINLFNYCCCKTTVSFSRRSRGGEARPSGDVRVHIIPGYNMYSYTSPQRERVSGGGSGCSKAHSSGGKRCTSMASRPTGNRPNGRDVYEL